MRLTNNFNSRKAGCLKQYSLHKNPRFSLNKCLFDYQFFAIFGCWSASIDKFELSECSLEGTGKTKVGRATEIKTLPAVFVCISLDSPWPMKCHDTYHTGQSPYSTTDNNGAELWRFRTDDAIEGSPIIGEDGIIYFGDWWRDFYALYPNGTIKWKFRFSEGTTGIVWSAPAISEEGTIYIGSYTTYLYAVNPDGSLKWKFGAGGSISSSPVIAKDGTIYFGTMKGFGGGDIIAVNPDGTEKWRYPTGYYITSDPAIADDGTIYIGSGDTYLYAMYSNGTLRWRFKTENYVKGPPSIATDGTIYFGSYDGYLYALNPNGTMKWKHSIGWGSETNPSIGNDGTIYIGGGQLYAINPNGTLKWSFNLGDDRWIGQSSPAISADGTIYIGTIIGDGNGGEIIAVNPNGTERWRRKIANQDVDSSPCISDDGTVYIGSTSNDPLDVNNGSYGYLYAFGKGEMNPPDPPVISGPVAGRAGEYHRYTFQTTDPEEHKIYYYADWGDGTSMTGWAGPYDSGEALSLDHLYTFEGTYTIKAKAKDRYDMESGWSTLEVTMPKNKAINPFLLFLERLIERFPILEQILQPIYDKLALT